MHITFLTLTGFAISIYEIVKNLIYEKSKRITLHVNIYVFFTLINNDICYR